MKEQHAPPPPRTACLNGGTEEAKGGGREGAGPSQLLCDGQCGASSLTEGLLVDSEAADHVLAAAPQSEAVPLQDDVEGFCVDKQQISWEEQFSLR